MITVARRGGWQRIATAIADYGRDARFAGWLLALVLAGVAGELGQASIRAAARVRRPTQGDTPYPTQLHGNGSD